MLGGVLFSSKFSGLYVSCEALTYLPLVLVFVEAFARPESHWEAMRGPLYPRPFSGLSCGDPPKRAEQEGVESNRRDSKQFALVARLFWHRFEILPWADDCSPGHEDLQFTSDST